MIYLFNMWRLYHYILHYFVLDKNNIIQQFSDLQYTISNTSITATSDGSKLESFQNSYRYYIPMDPPKVFQYFLIQRTSNYYLTICEVRIFATGIVNRIFLNKFHLSSITLQLLTKYTAQDLKSLNGFINTATCFVSMGFALTYSEIIKYWILRES